MVIKQFQFLCCFIFCKNEAKLLKIEQENKKMAQTSQIWNLQHLAVGFGCSLLLPPGITYYQRLKSA